MTWKTYKQELDKKREAEKERSVVYKFNTSDAKRFGLNESIILYNFRHWLKLNIKDNRHIHDGRVWTFNSFTKLESIFTFFTRRQIRTAINNLRDSNIIVVGNYNKRKSDKTQWYSVNETKFRTDNLMATTEYKWTVIKTPEPMLEILDNSDGNKCIQTEYMELKSHRRLGHGSHRPGTRKSQVWDTKVTSWDTEVTTLPDNNPCEKRQIKNADNNQEAGSKELQRTAEDTEYEKIKKLYEGGSEAVAEYINST